MRNALRFVGWCTGMLGLVGATAVAAEPANTFGGRVGGRQGYVVAGYPDSEGGVILPLGDRIDLTPRFRLGYSVTSLYGLGGLTLSFEPGVRFRFMALDAGALKGSFTATIDVGVATPAGSFGLGAPWITIGLLDPGWMMTARVGDVVDLDFGFYIEPILLIPASSGVVGFVLNVPFVFGAGFEVTEGVVLLTHFEGGPSFSGVSGRSFGSGGVGFNVRGWVGAGFDF